ncbi:MAG: hypothetical protein AUJ85_03810 [Elusimicrobia bacterium CG1_02_37_114]|nr:MAG: hypothetical protein AUJ85_03810 [Elusimicrobia bacterium CG1_02_37_114]
MKQKTRQLQKHLKEIYVVEPNDLGFPLLTFIYRKINIFFKNAPFIFLVPLSFIGATLIVYVFGLLAVRLVSLLQYGF